MKSAVELALEKTGGDVEEIPSEKKDRLAKVEAEYKAKVAEAELAFDEKLAKSGGDMESIERIKADRDVELASLRSKRDRKKEEIRRG